MSTMARKWRRSSAAADASSARASPLGIHHLAAAGAGAAAAAAAGVTAAAAAAAVGAGAGAVWSAGPSGGMAAAPLLVALLTLSRGLQ